MYVGVSDMCARPVLCQSDLQSKSSACSESLPTEHHVTGLLCSSERIHETEVEVKGYMTEVFQYRGKFRLYFGGNLSTLS